MGIQDKIEEIRRKPEHIRVRYAWMYTAIVMFFVILIWIMSFSAGKEDSTQSDAAIIQPDILNQFQEGKKSLKDTTDQIKGVTQSLKEQGQAQNNMDESQKNMSGQEGFSQ
jgi:hypothetical protein